MRKGLNKLGLPAYTSLGFRRYNGEDFEVY
jgi:hypothetical protein